MSVTIHKKKSLSNLPVLSDLVKTELVGLDDKRALFLKEAFIRTKLAKNPKFNIWEPLVYHWTDGTTLKLDNVYVSIKGAICYEVDGELHTNYGNLDNGTSQVSLTILGSQHTLQLARAVASTFLTVPDVYSDIKESELQVSHLDNQNHQCHFSNLEWKLNKSETDSDLIEKTVSILKADLPTKD